jgi:acetyl esterase/lipase
LALAALTLAYGPGPDQVGDLYLPHAANAPLVCLFHGGFWRLPYGRDELAPMATDLQARGFAVWNLEYHRVGPGGPGWPATFKDIDALLAYLPALQQMNPVIDLRRVAFVGHSAGGHLAFWAAARASQMAQPIHPTAAIGLAPLLDLVAVQAAHLGENAVEAFLGGSPAAVPDRYRLASPRALLPLHIRQYLLHGDADTAVPIELSREYVDAARRAGDDATCLELPGTDHMAFLDPRSEAHATLCRCLTEATLAHPGA